MITRLPIRGFSRGTSLRLVLTAATVGALCLGGADARAQGQPALSKVIVGGPASVSFMPFFTAIAQGMFAKRGIEIDWLETNTPDPAVISGETNMMLKVAEASVIATSRGKPLPVIVMVQQFNSLSFDAAASLDLGENQKKYPDFIRGLKGKTIALPVRGASADNFAKQIMADAGLQEGADYSFVVLGSGANIITALKANRVDAAVLWPPFSQQAYADKAAKPLVQMAAGQGPETFSKSAGIGVLVNPDYLKTHQKEAKAIADAIVEATAFNRDYDKNKETLIDIGIRYSGIKDRAVLAEAIKVTSSLAYPGVDCSAWQVTVKYLMNTNGITRAPSCDELIATNIAPTGPLRR